MDTRDTPEQAELRRSARQLASERAAVTVADLDDDIRTRRLTDAVRDAGWLELRDDGGEGAPVAGGAEAAIVAGALGESVADVAFTGPLLARDLARRAGASLEFADTVAYATGLGTAATAVEGVVPTPAFAVDGAGPALVLVADGPGYRLAQVAVDGASTGADLTRDVRAVAAGTTVDAVESSRPLDDADLATWRALGLALTSADLVGVMQGVLTVTVEYASARRQFGVPVGSFQAVQHLLADAHCLTEGARSVSLHAAWAVDHLDPVDALSAGRVAKAYCARAARTVGETAVQVHGGIGNTWECLVHVYLRRALLSAQWFGDDAVQLRELARERLGAADGLP